MFSDNSYKRLRSPGLLDCGVLLVPQKVQQIFNKLSCDINHFKDHFTNVVLYS